MQNRTIQSCTKQGLTIVTLSYHERRETGCSKKMLIVGCLFKAFWTTLEIYGPPIHGVTTGSPKNLFRAQGGASGSIVDLYVKVKLRK